VTDSPFAPDRLLSRCDRPPPHLPCLLCLTGWGHYPVSWGYRSSAWPRIPLPYSVHPLVGVSTPMGWGEGMGSGLRLGWPSLRVLPSMGSSPSTRNRHPLERDRPHRNPSTEPPPLTGSWTGRMGKPQHPIPPTGRSRAGTKTPAHTTPMAVETRPSPS